MHFYCLQFLIITVTFVYCRSDELTSTKTQKADDSLCSPAVWLNVRQIDRLESKMEKLRNDYSKDIKTLQAKVQLLKKTETFVGFHAQLLADKVLVPSERVVFNYVIYNNGSAYDRYTGIFKAPYDGEYYFTSSFLSRSTAKMVHLQMFKNDVEISRGHGTTPGSQTGTMSAIIHLNEGDDVYVRHHDKVGNEMIHGQWSFFTGFLLRRTI